jgi:hypothetical protein
MTKYDKLRTRFLTKPKDFTWQELVKILEGLDYCLIQGGKTGGSRVRFIHAEYPPITLHKPHPKPVLKHYQLDAVISLLKQEGLL